MLFDKQQCDIELYRIGELARQDYNLGNSGNWYFSFHRGLDGFYSRMKSLEEHRILVYEWHPNVSMLDHESNIAIILFCMDSAFECVVFALNALGQARLPNDFRIITDDRALRQISPRDVIGDANRPPLPGWNLLFPQFQSLCKKHSVNLLDIIVNNHDITKHRTYGFVTGEFRTDPPDGFYERLGVSEEPHRRLLAPMKDVLLYRYPKLPIDQQSSNLNDSVSLEQLIQEFRAFANDAICFANNDAQSTLQLPYPNFV